MHQTQALEEVKTEHAKYFEALQKHPRMLVGMRVPSIHGEGEEVLKDSADAKDWQDAVKSLLSDEIRSRAATSAEADAGVMQTLHASIEVLQHNPDMVPGTKQFDRELADNVIKMVKPYELRAEGKLHGWSIPVQPLVEQERARLVAARAAQAQAPVAQAAPEAKAPPKPQQQPQAGIPAKAGSGAEQEDFSTLFGTLGLPNFRI